MYEQTELAPQVQGAYVRAPRGGRFAVVPRLVSEFHAWHPERLRGRLLRPLLTVGPFVRPRAMNRRHQESMGNGR